MLSCKKEAPGAHQEERGGERNTWKKKKKGERGKKERNKKRKKMKKEKKKRLSIEILALSNPTWGISKRMVVHYMPQQPHLHPPSSSKAYTPALLA